MEWGRFYACVVENAFYYLLKVPVWKMTAVRPNSPETPIVASTKEWTARKDHVLVRRLVMSLTPAGCPTHRLSFRELPARH